MEFKWKVPAQQHGLPLEKVLRRQHGLSRRQVVRLKRQPGSVVINGTSAPVVQILAVDDWVEVTMAEHLEPPPPEDIALDIIFEDEHILVLNKPGNIVSHPTKGYAGGTLANALSHHWLQQGESRPARLVTRLDRETSGLVLVAKSAWCHHRLSNTKIHKEYLAVTRGIPQPDQGEIDQPIGRSPDNPKKRGVNPQGKPALTRYWTVKTGENLALVRLVPHTGRTHQLRIHMAHIGCPLVDDFMYGRVEGLVGRTALHAYKVEFNHPQSQQKMQFTAPIPNDFSGLVGID